MQKSLHCLKLLIELRKWTKSSIIYLILQKVKVWFWYSRLTNGSLYIAETRDLSQKTGNAMIREREGET